MLMPESQACKQNRPVPRNINRNRTEETESVPVPADDGAPVRIKGKHGIAQCISIRLLPSATVKAG